MAIARKIGWTLLLINSTLLVIVSLRGTGPPRSIHATQQVPDSQQRYQTYCRDTARLFRRYASELEETLRKAPEGWDKVYRDARQGCLDHINRLREESVQLDRLANGDWDAMRRDLARREVEHREVTSNRQIFLEKSFQAPLRQPRPAPTKKEEHARTPATQAPQATPSFAGI